MRIGLLTGGGDCPGLNAVIRAVVRRGLADGEHSFIGFRHGWAGVLEDDWIELTYQSTTGILPRGGTILGTSRTNPFAEGRDGLAAIRRTLSRRGVDAMIPIGGEDTLGVAVRLGREGVAAVGVPKTIDNDLLATDQTFGFDTALHTVTDAIDKIHTTAESHHRIMLVEVMGRTAGWIALGAGIAGGAHVILLPEIPFSIGNVCKFVEERQRSGKRFTIIVVAEGIELPGDIEKSFVSERRSMPRQGAKASLVGAAIAAASKREVRVTVLGHIQRGGSPSPFDRILGTRFGVAAVDLIARREFGKMVTLRGPDVEAVPIEEACRGLRLVDPKGGLVHTARSIGISFGDR
jgi:6-phosphofructokinase 1